MLNYMLLQNQWYIGYIDNEKYIYFKSKKISLTKVRIKSKCQLKFIKIKTVVAAVEQYEYKSYRNRC